jgi:hypothetical protein
MRELLENCGQNAAAIFFKREESGSIEITTIGPTMNVPESKL